MRVPRVNTKKLNNTRSQIEETQSALRECITKAKELAAESDRLIKQHRKEVGGKEG